MTTFQKMFNSVIAGIVVILLILVVISGGVKPAVQKAGGVYEQVTSYFYAGINVGPTGTTVNNNIEGTCAMIAPAATVTASSTVAADCAVTGVVSGDRVLFGLSTTTVPSPLWGSTSPSWRIVSAGASTTPGYISFIWKNDTGGSAVLSASGIASTVPYKVSR